MELLFVEKVAVAFGVVWAVLVYAAAALLSLSTRTTLLCVAAAELSWLWYGYSLRFKLRGIPGPAPRLFSGHLKLLLDEGAPALYRRLHKEYGGVFRLYMGRRQRVVVCDVDLIGRIGNTDFSIYDGRPSPSIRPRETTSLLSIRGPLWHRIRNALVPTFSANQLRSVVPHLMTATERMNRNLSLLKPDQPIDVMSAWSSMTMAAIGLVAFGTDFKCQDLKNPNDAHPIVDAAKAIFRSTRLNELPVQQVIGAFPFLLPVVRVLSKRLLAKTAALWDAIDVTSYDVVQRRKADPNWNNVNDLLTRILEAKDDKQNPLSNIEVRDQVNTFLLAGYETTASTLTYATLLLSQNPKAQERMLEEIDRLTAQTPAAELDFENLESFTYLECVIKESLRLYPVGMVSRAPNVDTHIAGFAVPAGSMVHCPAHAVHYDEQYFDAPYEFRPERFLPDSPEQQRRPKNASLWFGIGPRQCIGARFAMEEAKLALIHVYSKFTFKLHASTPMPLRTVLGITLCPAYPVMMTVHARS